MLTPTLHGTPSSRLWQRMTYTAWLDLRRALTPFSFSCANFTIDQVAVKARCSTGRFALRGVDRVRD
jgi:hypothetical protein